MNKKVGILLSLGAAALLVTGCGSSSNNPTTTNQAGTEQQPNGETGGETGGETQASNELITAFSTEWLNEKTLYLIGFDDFGYDEMKWNMGSLTFDETTVSWREFDTPSANDEPFVMDYIVENDGSVLLTEFETNMRVTQQQTADFLVICMGDDCNVRLYYDEQKARDYRDSRNNHEDIPFTTAMLNGKTFYTRDEDNSGKGYASMTFTATEATRYEIWYDGDTVRGEDTFTFPYAIENEKIKLDFEGEMIMWDTLEDQDDYAWYVRTEKENYPLDGTIDSTKMDIWYISKPADFPEGI